MALKNFPIGIQDFPTIRDCGYYYVDKTDLVYNLTHTSRYYFLSRPRRFGKSLLISTLQCYFEGRKELFTGLAMDRLETEWKKHPVIRLDLSTIKDLDEQLLADNMNDIFVQNEKKFGIQKDASNSSWGSRLSNLIRTAHEQTGEQVVVLVDEYDAPVLEAMHDKELLAKTRNRMRDLYAPLKSLGAILRFVFLTGISKFSQLSIFSELNNLKIITMSDEYAAICGITKEELLTQMQPEIQALADKNGLTYEGACAALQRQYDGYHFSKKSPDVYNPFSLINSLSDGELTNYWFATGTPTILTHLVKKYKMDPEQFSVGFAATQEIFDAPTETATNPIPMLYQSGYLTIKEYEDGEYTLMFPNDEVRLGFLKALMPYYAAEDVVQNDSFTLAFTKALKKEKMEDALVLIKSFISGVPYNATKQNESYYRTLFFLIFKLCTPFVVRAEECSAAGRADAIVETANCVYVFEFKLNSNGTAEDALKQIDEKGYLIPYSATVKADGSIKKLYKIGVSFNEEKRTIGEWLVKEG